MLRLVVRLLRPPPLRQVAVQLQLSSASDATALVKRTTASCCVQPTSSRWSCTGSSTKVILPSSHRDELYLFDQHACDEKYRFEDLIQNQKVSYQQCIAPIRMRLTPSREQLV